MSQIEPKKSAAQDKIFNELNQLYKEGKYAPCIAGFHSYYASNPTVSKNDVAAADLCETIASAYYMQENHQEAITYYEFAKNIRSKLQPNSKQLASTYNNLGLVYKAKPNYKEAIACFENSIKIRNADGSAKTNSSELCRVQNNLALCYKGEHRYTEAIETVEKCVELRKQENQPYDTIDNAKSFNVMGLIYKDMGQYDQATKWMLQAKDIFEKKAPKSVEYSIMCYNVANIYVYQQNFTNALEYYDKCIAVRNDMPMSRNLALAYRKKAVVYSRLLNYEQAVHEHICELKIHQNFDVRSPESVQCQLNVAFNFEKWEKYTEACEWRHKAFDAFNEENVDKYDQLIRCRVAKAISKNLAYKAGNVPTDIKHLIKAVMCYAFLPPHHPLVLVTKFRLAFNQQSVGNNNDAIALCKEICAADDQFKWGYLLEAKAEVESNYYDSALALIQKSLNIDHCYYDAAIAYIRVYLKKGDYDSARNATNQYCDLKHNNFNQDLLNKYSNMVQQTNVLGPQDTEQQKQSTMNMSLVRDQQLSTTGATSDYAEDEALEEVTCPHEEIQTGSSYASELSQLRKEIEHVSGIQGGFVDMPTGDESVCTGKCSIF